MFVIPIYVLNQFYYMYQIMKDFIKHEKKIVHEKLETTL